MSVTDQVLAGLQQKFSGVDTAILSRIASKRAEGITDEGQVNSIIEGISFSDVLNSYGDYRAEGATRTSILNYEKKHGLKDGKKAGEDTAGKEKQDGVPEWFEAYRKEQDEKYDTLKRESDTLKAEKQRTERQSLITAKAKELGIPEWRMKEGFAISDDADEKTINDYLAGVQKNIVTAGLEGKSQGFPLSTTEEKSKELAKEWAQNLPDKE